MDGHYRQRLNDEQRSRNEEITWGQLLFLMLRLCCSCPIFSCAWVRLKRCWLNIYLLIYESVKGLILEKKKSLSFLLFGLGISFSGFRVEAIDGVKLHLLDDVSSWEPGDQIVVASTDYSMYQAEEFTLLPCPECGRFQVKVKGIRLLRRLLGKHSSWDMILGILCFSITVVVIIINTEGLSSGVLWTLGSRRMLEKSSHWAIMLLLMMHFRQISVFMPVSIF